MFLRSAAAGTLQVTTRTVSAVALRQGRTKPSLEISVTRFKISSHQLRSTSSSTTELTSRRLPVAVFIDLDNVPPQSISRADIKNFTDPLREFAEAAGDLQIFKAYANEYTTTWNYNKQNPEIAEQIELHGWRNDQDYIPWDDDEGIAQTGYDEEENLRCGVCGAKMKLTKKDRHNGLTPFKKLHRHMKQLHDREQEKRKTRLNMKAKKGKAKPKWARLSEKEMEKFRKYEAAQVGLGRTPATRQQKGKGEKKKMNDFFRILREEKVQCQLSKDVDQSIISASESFMQKTIKAASGNSDICGILCVVSEDGDFSELLRRKRFITVAVTPASPRQTDKLARNCDIVLCKEGEDFEDIDNIDDTVEVEFGPLIAKPVTPKGEALLEAIESFKDGISNVST